MTNRKLSNSLAVVAIALVASTASFQASAGQCPFNLPFLSGSNCNSGNEASAPMANLNANVPSRANSCNSANTGKASGASCASSSNEELGSAMVGVASGGMQIAGTVMRAIAGGANRLLGPDPEF